mgnify:CR=1 FL=1
MKLATDFIPVDCTSLEVGGVSGKLYLLDYEDYLTSKSGFTHTLQAFIPSKGMDIKKEIACYVNYRRAVGLLVLDSSIVAQVFGNDVGLQVTAYEEAPNDPSKGGGFDVTFSTPSDVTLENLPPTTFFDTSRTVTLAALLALKTPVV